MGTHKKTYIFAHRGGWKYKKHIPADLRPLFSNKTAWTKYLGSVSRTEAELTGRAMGVEADRLIRQLRALDASERADIAQKGGLSAYQDFPTGTDIGLRFVDASATRFVDAGDGESALDVLDSQATAKRMRAEAAQARRTLARLGEAKGGSDLEALVLLWQHQKPRTDSTGAVMRRHVRRFVGVVGDISVQDVTRNHVLAFKHALERRDDIESPSVEKHLQTLNTLFKIAQNATLLNTNPAAGVRATKPVGKFADEKSKKPFTTEQVRAIFAAMEDESPDFQWVVRLLAYHGGNSGEICQLRVDDVTELYGLPVIRIHDRHGKIKNKYCLRDVPLHPACMGLFKYAKAARGPWLFSFPDWRGRAGKFQRRGGPFLRQKAKIADLELTMHSFRHLWSDLARNVEMPEVYANAIQGHALGKGHQAAYGRGPSLPKLAEWIRRIDPLP
jgi:integrase